MPRCSMSRPSTSPRLAALVLIALAGVTGAARPAAAQQPPPSPFQVGPSKIDEVIEERTYYYRHMDYDPAVVVRPVARGDAAYDTPEGAAIAQISSMLAADVAWWRDTWTRDSREQMIARDREQGRAPTYWSDLWRERLAGKQAVLERRIETGPYVLIVYRIQPATGPSDDPAQSFHLTAVLVEEDGRWSATQALTEDPVLHYWHQPGYRVKKMVRGFEATPR